MPVLSIDEAKLLATVLQKSFPEGKRPVPGRGKWLNHLARADGYRDWNVMVAAAHAQPPHLKWGEWGDLFVAIAWVEFPGCEPKFHMLATRDRGQAHPHNGWPGELAAAIGADLHRRLRGVKFHYGRPDVLRSEDNSWGPLAGYSFQPIEVTSSDNATRILLWWLEGRYTQALSGGPEESVVSYQLHFEYRAYGEEPRADQFLHCLTGLRRPRRTCLYVPDVANADDDRYLPIVVTEDEQDGVILSGWTPGDWESTWKLVADANSRAGLSQLDVSDIAERYVFFAPREEDDIFEFYGMSED